MCCCQALRFSLLPCCFPGLQEWPSIPNAAVSDLPDEQKQRGGDLILPSCPGRVRNSCNHRRSPASPTLGHAHDMGMVWGEGGCGGVVCPCAGTGVCCGMGSVGLQGCFAVLSTWVLAAMQISGCGACCMCTGCRPTVGSTYPFTLMSVLWRQISGASGCSLIYLITP